MDAHARPGAIDNAAGRALFPMVTVQWVFHLYHQDRKAQRIFAMLSVARTLFPPEVTTGQQNLVSLCLRGEKKVTV